MNDPNGTRRTPLYELHMELGAKIVPFAGYDMPLHYERGILGEHRHTREQAGLFDVSHMGQVRIDDADPAAALEALVPANLRSLGSWRMRYTVLTNEAGGILDDLIVTRANGHLHVVVNAACREADIAHMRAGLGNGVTVTPHDERALMALQGPAAAAVLTRHAPGVAELVFMSAAEYTVAGIDCLISRSGYTGEDGFEISLNGDRASDLARLLVAEPEVEPVGLGARDSLRLEAGLCLYGHDIDVTTTPVEAALEWTIGKSRREAGDFPGAAVILKQLSEGAPRRRVGIRPEGRAPAREHTPILGPGDEIIGKVTSGGFGPTLGAPVAMGYVQAQYAKPGTKVGLMIRGKRHGAEIAPTPFVPHRYARA